MPPAIAQVLDGAEAALVLSILRSPGILCALRTLRRLFQPLPYPREKQARLSSRWQMVSRI